MIIIETGHKSPSRGVISKGSSNFFESLMQVNQKRVPKVCGLVGPTFIYYINIFSYEQ